MISAAQITSAGLVVLVTSGIIISAVVGIGVAVILSIIPTYTATRNNFTPTGEQYCFNSLTLNVTFNSTSPYGNFVTNSTNTSYALSEACLRILQSYSYDRLLAACLISNCAFTSNVAISSVLASPNMTCSAVIYYSTRCSDEAASSGVNNTISSTNSACRDKRLSNIYAALGSSSGTQYTNVPSLTVSNTVLPIRSIYSVAFSLYSQGGPYYCGAVSQASISSAVSAQASG